MTATETSSIISNFEGTTPNAADLTHESTAWLTAKGLLQSATFLRSWHSNLTVGNGLPRFAMTWERARREGEGSRKKGLDRCLRSKVH